MLLLYVEAVTEGGINGVPQAQDHETYECPGIRRLQAPPDLIKPPAALLALVKLAASVCYSASSALTHIPANLHVVALRSN